MGVEGVAAKSTLKSISASSTIAWVGLPVGVQEPAPVTEQDIGFTPDCAVAMVPMFAAAVLYRIVKVRVVPEFSCT